MRAQPRSPSRSRLAIIRSPSPMGGPAGRVMSWAAARSGWPSSWPSKRGAPARSAPRISPRRGVRWPRLGADIVLDPAEGTGFPNFAELGVPTNPLQRAASIGMGSEPPRAVIFKAVGKPGLIPQIIDAAPPGSRIVVAGVNTQGDRFVSALAIVKELELRFGFGYAPSEFAETLARVARDPAAVAPLITSTVGVEGVTGAIDALRSGEQIKVLIEH